MITRHNYEEFLLLYMDNELSVADRKLVEQFILLNPDLAEEWESLEQCKIEPDTNNEPAFAGKEQLMRFSGIGADNHEEYLLSYIDNELDGHDRDAVEGYIRRQPSRQMDLERLRQAINLPDLTIRFPDKEGLYKKEGRRPVLIFWSRVAAAAVVLAAIGLLIFHTRAALAPGKGEDAAKAAGRDIAGKSIKKEDPVVTPVIPDALHAKTEKKDSGGTDFRGIAVQKRVKEKMNEVAPREKEEEIAAIEKPAAARTIGIEKITHPEDNAIAAADPGVADPKVADPGIVSGHYKEAATFERTVTSNFATQALLKNNASAAGDADNDPDETEPASTKKNKLRGIFRKVSRAFEKTADRDEDGQRKVLIGAFQVALK
jgi:hypothetical protein